MNSCNQHLMEVGFLYEGIHKHTAISLSTFPMYMHVCRWSRGSSQSMLTECCPWPEHEELPHSL